MASKKKSSKKAPKAEAKKPKAKKIEKAPKSSKAPKSEKTKKTLPPPEPTAGDEKRTKRVRRDVTTDENGNKKYRYRATVSVSAKDLTSEQKEAIEVAELAETDIEDAKERFSTALQNLVDVLGSNSFEHPERGHLTVMSRGDIRWWRAKPQGRKLKE